MAKAKRKTASSAKAKAPAKSAGPTVPPKWRALLLLIPGYDPFRDAGACRFDIPAAERAIDFFHQRLSHVKGEKGGTPLTLEPWQQAIIANLFGWKRPDRTRRYREAFIYIPRKNGKTVIVAGLAVFVTFCDGEPGAECYSAAAEQDQAALCFDMAKQMVLTNPVLSSNAQVFTMSMIYPRRQSVYKAISAKAATKHGYNAHLVIVDELHAQPNRELVDVLSTSTAARRQPLIVHITTADFARPSICNEKLDYATKVRDGVVPDPYLLPVIYAAGKDDDWKDPKTWAKANPNLGVSVSLSYLEAECKKAQETPAYENTFKRLHLNIVTEQANRWLSLDKWDACGEVVPPAVLEGRPCFAGLDLSATTDVTAFVLVFPPAPDREDPKWRVLPFFWIPGDQAHLRERRDRVPYLTWHRQGLLTLTDGDVIDYDLILAAIIEMGTRYDIREIAFDRWGATQISLQLQGSGFTVVPFGQGFKDMSPPTKELEKLVLAQEIAHGGNAVLRWMAANVATESDAAGNLKPSKAKSTGRIDGIVATIMGIGRATAQDPSAGKSVYDEPGGGVISLG